MDRHTRFNCRRLLPALALTLLSGAALSQEIESSIARGGRLYDKLFAENKTAKPAADHPSSIKDGKYGKDASWRCKNCHGRDYKRKEPADHVRATMQANDSRECRNRHRREAMDPHKMSERGREKMEQGRKDGQTCIECHHGVAHALPKRDD